MHRAHIRDKQYEEYSMDVHKKKLKSMKPAIDNKEPGTFSHLRSQRKRIQMESDKLSKIERDNALLLAKMNEIASKPSLIDNHNDNKYRHSLNYEYRQKEADRINGENYEFVKRMIANPPQYKRSDWENERQKQLQYLQNRCEFPVLAHHKEVGKIKAKEDTDAEDRRRMLEELANVPPPPLNARSPNNTRKQSISPTVTRKMKTTSLDDSPFAKPQRSRTRKAKQQQEDSSEEEESEEEQEKKGKKENYSLSDSDESW